MVEKSAHIKTNAMFPSKSPLEFALKEYGTHGEYGDLSNPDVLKYFSEIGADWVKNDDVAWCSAFLNWCLMKAKLKFSSSLLARDFLKYGKETKGPVLGDIVVFWRIAKSSPYGHVGFYISESFSTIFVLGGNEDNEVKIKAYPKTQVLGYRSYLTK